MTKGNQITNQSKKEKSNKGYKPLWIVISFYRISNYFITTYFK